MPCNLLCSIDESGNLQCAYHGWSFNNAGKCVNIPQVCDTCGQQSSCHIHVLLFHGLFLVCS